MTDPNVARSGGAADRNVAAAAQRKPLTSTERSRNSRARQRQAAAIAQRHPKHGAYSAATVDPLGAQIVAELLESDDCPDHLHQARYSAALAAWGRAEATVRLLAGYIAQLPGVPAALTTLSRSDESSEHKGGRGARQVTAKLMGAPLEALDRAERRAAMTRDALGLSPASAVRMKVELGSRGPNLFQLAAALVESDRLAALEGGGDGE